MKTPASRRSSDSHEIWKVGPIRNTPRAGGNRRGSWPITASAVAGRIVTEKDLAARAGCKLLTQHVSVGPPVDADEAAHSRDSEAEADLHARQRQADAEYADEGRRAVGFAEERIGSHPDPDHLQAETASELAALERREKTSARNRTGVQSDAQAAQVLQTE